MANSNEEFLADLERDYPGQDWDGLPDLDSAPDVYVTRGRSSGRAFEVDGDYETPEEAASAVEDLRANPAWVGTDWSSIEILPRKPRHLTELHLMRELRAGVLAGVLRFPVLGP